MTRFHIATPLSFSLSVFWSGCLLASTVSVGKMEMKTYPFSDPDPVPATSQTRYPYFRYDRTYHEGSPAKWQTVTLENDNIRVIMLPQVGGKIWTATDKKTGRDFLFANHVMKFRDIAMRGPWTAGGIEFNFGIIGHSPNSGTPVDWFARENPDGSASCFVAAQDYITRTFWQVEVRLPRDAEEFETHVVWYNSSSLPAPYYHWMNAAYSVENNPQFLFPGKNVIGHEGEIETRAWPIMEKNGRRVDDMPGNEWGGPKSYHILPGHNGFYGIWWRDLGFGSYHRSEPYEKFGRKIWLQTMSPYGLLWMKFKTDSDGQNAELQSGRCFNQPRYNTYKTPFKHQTFAPGSTETFAEHWGPIRDMKEVASDMSDTRPMPKPRPIDAPADFDWNSAYGEYVRGTQAIAEHYDALGRDHLERAIAKDRFFAPAYSELAAAEMRRGNYARVHELCEKALAINAYDPLANYTDGFAYFVESDQTTARERLGIAAQQPQYRAPALALIARGYLRDGDAKSAADAAQKALKANDLNLDALLALAVAMRGEDADKRKAFIGGILARVPLAHAFRYELALAGGERDFTRHVACELPAQTYMEIGCWYAESGLAEDARRFFALAGENPIAKIWLGDLEGAKKLKAGGVFPFRRETLPQLETAVEKDGHWKFRYMLAVLKAYFGYDKEADALLESCGDKPDEATFYQYRATRRKGDAAIADLMRAKGIEDSWRIGRHLAEIYEERKDFAKVLEVTSEYLKTWPERDPLRLAYANALLKLKRYRECMDYLKTVTLLPSEHRGSGTAIWHEAQDALGLPRTWPENLGKGEPYPDAVDATVQQVFEPERQFRGVWVATVYDPRFSEDLSKKSVDGIKAYWRSILDAAERVNVNAVFFQVRPCADAFYKSELEPWSLDLRGEQGKEPEGGFDPLQFMIDECHARGMQLHAWFNPFRVTYNDGDEKKLAKTHNYFKQPDWFVKYGKSVYYDPGVPACRDWTVKVVMDVATRYDIDGIHIDDYFYPYDIKDSKGRTVPFPDEKSFGQYGGGFASVDKWRDNNSDSLVADLARRLRNLKPDVVFGVAPFNDNDYCVRHLHCDSLKWAKNGWIDYLIPQLYYGESCRRWTFWWDSKAGNCGLFAGRFLKNLTQSVGSGPRKGMSEFDNMVEMHSQMTNLNGVCWWSAQRLMQNESNVTDRIAAQYLRKTLVPLYCGRSRIPPPSVVDVRAERRDGHVTLRWRHPEDDASHKVVFTAVFRGDDRNPVALVQGTSFDVGPSPDGVWRLVALDRLQNAAEPSIITVK